VIRSRGHRGEAEQPEQEADREGERAEEEEETRHKLCTAK